MDPYADSSEEIKSIMPTFDDLQEYLFSNEKCLIYLINQGVFQDEKICGVCNRRMKLEIDKNNFRCSNRECRKRETIRKDTIFEETRLEYRKILLLAYLFLNKTLITCAASMSGLNINTVSKFFQKFRQQIEFSLDDDSTFIGGPDIIVEIDESKFGKVKYHRGRRVEGVWIIGGIEHTDQKRCFLEKIDKRDSETLIEVIQRHVHPESIIHTDLWQGYNDLQNEGFQHRTVNHSENFVDPDTGVHTNTIEGLWSGIKQQIRPRHRTSKITEHLIEFIWRKVKKNELWGSFLYSLSLPDFSNS